MRVMGVDGGVSGALAILSGDTGRLEIFDVPTFEITIGKGTRNEIDVAAFIKICRIAQFNPEGLDKILFEYGQGVREQSAAAAYKYGYTNGNMTGATAAMDIPYELIEPGIWKRAMRLTGKTKDDSRKLATQLFPTMADWFKRKTMDHGRAEAALIAYYELHRRG